MIKHLLSKHTNTHTHRERREEKRREEKRREEKRRVKKRASEKCPQRNRMEVIIQLKFSFPDDSTLYPVDKN